MSEKTVCDDDGLARLAKHGNSELVQNMAGELLIQRQLERAVRDARYAAGNPIAAILRDLDRWRDQ